MYLEREIHVLKDLEHLRQPMPLRLMLLRLQRGIPRFIEYPFENDKGCKPRTWPLLLTRWANPTWPGYSHCADYCLIFGSVHCNKSILMPDPNYDPKYKTWNSIGLNRIMPEDYAR